MTFEKEHKQFEIDRDNELTDIDTEEIATTELDELIEVHKKFKDLTEQTQKMSDHLLKVIKNVVERLG